MDIETSEIKSPETQKKNYKKFYIVAALVIIAFLIGLQLGGDGSVVSGNGEKTFVEKNRSGAPTEVDWDLLWNAIDTIDKKFVDGPVDLQQILYGAVSGAVGSLKDPYSVFLPPKQAEEFQDELKGNLEGIGAEIAIKNERLTVVSPLDDSPAQQAGIKAGDFVWKVDGEETLDMSLQEAVSKIRGEAGSQVTLAVFHAGATEAEDITITRAKIVVKSTESRVEQRNGKKIGYVKMRRFGEDSKGILDKAISDFLLEDVDGVVLDLRNNPGGFLETAVEIASNWVKDGMPVVSQKFGDGTEDVFRAQGQSRLAGIPTVVLINGGSASASEIVAGALGDYSLATLVGEKSFGKGSVQELVSLQDGADLKITIAKWLTPGGHNLNQEGLEPNETVELTDEDFSADNDPQLDRALEILSQ